VAALARLVTYECVAAGVRHGLALADMAPILHGASGWSLESRAALAQLDAGARVSKESFGPVTQTLSMLAAIGQRVGAPMPIACAVRSVAESAYYGDSIQFFGD
jgi:3-hydroxyisobutyrate dehydrogenase